MILTIETMINHVKELGIAFKLPVRFHRGTVIDKSSAFLERRAIRIGATTHLVGGQRWVVTAPITDEASYAVALHELGHCLAPNGMLIEGWSIASKIAGQPTTVRDVRLLIESEIAAWQWAEHYALDWTPTMAHIRKITFGTYRRGARQAGVKLDFD